jgi:hypothetical protein
MECDRMSRDLRYGRGGLLYGSWVYSLGISFFLATLLFDFHKEGSWKRQQGYSDYLSFKVNES